jgi:hypothetical protein
MPLRHLIPASLRRAANVAARTALNGGSAAFLAGIGMVRRFLL